MSVIVDECGQMALARSAPTDNRSELAVVNEAHTGGHASADPYQPLRSFAQVSALFADGIQPARSPAVSR
jgi:hypothetical protein